MAANTNAIFTLTPNIAVGQTISAANTAKDGTGTVVTIHTAGTNASKIFKINFQPLGSNIATVARIFINNGSTNTVAGNNSFYKDISLIASTLSETVTTPATELAMNITIQAGYKILITLGTAVAAGYAVQAVAEDF